MSVYNIEGDDGLSLLCFHPVSGGGVVRGSVGNKSRCVWRSWVRQRQQSLFLPPSPSPSPSHVSFLTWMAGALQPPTPPPAFLPLYLGACSFIDEFGRLVGWLAITYSPNCAIKQIHLLFKLNTRIFRGVIWRNQNLFHFTHERLYSLKPNCRLTLFTGLDSPHATDTIKYLPASLPSFPLITVVWCARQFQERNTRWPRGLHQLKRFSSTSRQLHLFI